MSFYGLNINEKEDHQLFNGNIEVSCLQTSQTVSRLLLNNIQIQSKIIRNGWAQFISIQSADKTLTLVSERRIIYKINWIVIVRSDFRNEINGILELGGFFSSDKFRLFN